MLARFFIVAALMQGTLGFSWSHFSSQDPAEIRKFLRYHRDLLDEYLIYGVENPGIRIQEVRVGYIFSVTAPDSQIN